MCWNKTAFTAAQEADIECDFILIEERLFGLKSTTIRRLANQVAVKNNSLKTFNTKKEIADNDCVYGFIEKHPNFSLSNLEN